MCVSAIFASWVLSRCRGCFHVVEIGRVPSIHNIRSVSTMTTADGAVRISQRLTYFLVVEIILYLSLQHLFFFIPFIIPATFSRSLPVVTQIRGHIAGPPPPSPLRHVLSFLPRGESSIFFPRRPASNCP